jgi:tetratricopeptide (TPR) repeat protein/tRNA A-37 threonylcarbamoyl transferase component Bud32
MQAERWQQIDEIFQSALRMEGSQRAAFLRETCSHDESLRLELERLLALHAKAEHFLEYPAVDVAAQALPGSEQTSDDLSNAEPAVVGQTISHYRIVAKLGRGGMGFVYEAEDIRLGRRVALKFLPANLARHPRALERFEREARAASSLNHPNICTIYEVEEHDKQPVIVMELLEGQSLQERMRKERVGLPELLDIGVQILGALEAAHAKGIVHRDIKPANIFLVGSGHTQLKVLDFGLAKWIPELTMENGTRDESLTFEGTIAGTTAYMSPEQALGEDIDGRSDLFSLGTLLSELATGRQPFARSNAVSTIDAILNADPDPPSAANPELPPELDRIIARMLEKRRESRYSSAEDVRIDLKKLQTGLPGSGTHKKSGTRLGRVRIFTALACLLAIGIAAVVFFSVRRRHVLGAKDTIVLGEFQNKTGDPVFDGTLRQGLATELEQSPFLSLVPDDRIQATLALMNRPANAPLTFEIGREVCERTGAAAILDGSITSFGSRYVLGLHAKNCRTGDVIDDEQVQAARKEDVLNVLSQIARKFRTQVGESLATVRELATPLAEATTPSLEALEQYSAALKMLLSPDPASAVPLLQRAIEIDPKFAMAYALLGRCYGDTWESALAAENITKAYQLRNRASDRERFFITLAYDLQVTGNLEKARRMGELWAQTYPRDRDAHAVLSSIYQGFGQYEKGAEEGKRSIEADPNFPPGYANLAWANVFLKRFSEADKVIEQARERKFEFPDLILLPYYIAFLNGDRGGMERQLNLARERPGAEDWLSNAQAFVLASAGHLQAARTMSRRAVGIAQQEGQKERVAMFEAGAAVREALFGNADEGSKSATAALAVSSARDVEYGTAFAAGVSGDLTRARSLATDLERRFPEDTCVNFTYVPVLRALALLHKGAPASAIELLQVSTPYEMGIPCSWFGFFGNLYPAYVRGMAYLSARRGVEAVAEFQKIVHDSALVWSDPVGVAARLQLTRALARSGNAAEAKANYQDFLSRWKDADPDIPILQQAKAEYGRLP